MIHGSNYCDSLLIQGCHWNRGSNQEGTDCAKKIFAEGLDYPENLVKLAEDDGVKTLCQNFRNPEGTEPQPGWITPNPNPQNITAPRFARSGQEIPAICE